MSIPFGWCFFTSFSASAMSWSLFGRQPGIFSTSASGSAASPTSFGSSIAHGTPAPSSALVISSWRLSARCTARRMSGSLKGGLVVLRKTIQIVLIGQR